MIEQNYNLNTIPSASPVPIVHVSQYDKGSRTLKFKLFEGSGEYSMASVNGAKINGKKPDGNEFSYNMTIAGNVVSVDVTEQMTAVAGRVVSEIVLTGANSSVLGTANFIIEVEESPINEGVISDTDIPVIVDFVTGGTAGQFFKRTATGGEWVDYIPSGASWGTITGNLADQTDLNNKFSEINNNINQKANTSDVNSALALKANTADVNTALATKADTSAVNTLAGSLAMIETSPATANHAVKDLIVYNNQLYKVTTAIASGEAIVVGTNIENTKVGDELSSLKSQLLNSVNLGNVADCNITNRKAGTLFFATYASSSLNAPSTTAGGYLFLFANADSADFGCQIAITNEAIYARRLQAGSYGSWLVIINFRK